MVYVILHILFPFLAIQSDFEVGIYNLVSILFFITDAVAILSLKEDD